MIDLAALDHNLRLIRSKARKRRIMAIVKANAYGHGILEITKRAIQNGIDYVGVGFLEEGLFLRQNDIDAPILVLGGILGYQVKKFIQNDLEITVSSLELAKHIDESAGGQTVRVHLKIDTGMERIGVSHGFAVEFVKRVAQLRHLQIVGLYSHFATADEEDKSFVKTQLDRFQSVVDGLRKAGIEVPLKHLANSGAMMDMDGASFDLIRPGITMYGMYPSAFVSHELPLKPVLTLSSKVVFVKRVAAGIGISYGHSYRTKADCTIVTIPIGYGDGYSRLFSNKAEVLIRSKRYPVVGAVCMDQIMVNVGNDMVEVGDQVILIGRMGDEEITAAELAGTMGTIPYEITCMINARVPRLYVN